MSFFFKFFYFPILFILHHDTGIWVPKLQTQKYFINPYLSRTSVDDSVSSLLYFFAHNKKRYNTLPGWLFNLS